MRSPIQTLTLAFAVGLALGCQDRAVTFIDDVQPRLGKGKGGGSTTPATVAFEGAVQTVTDQNAELKESSKQRDITDGDGEDSQYLLNLPLGADVDFSECDLQALTVAEAPDYWDLWAIDYAGLTHPDTGDPLMRSFVAKMSIPVEGGQFFNSWTQADGTGMLMRPIGNGGGSSVASPATVVEGPPDTFTYSDGVVELGFVGAGGGPKPKDRPTIWCPNDGTAFSPPLTITVTLMR